MSEWISVEDRLPDNTSEVLVADNYDCCVAWCRIADGKWILATDAIEIIGDAYMVLDLNITHWQPLPSPPK